MEGLYKAESLPGIPLRNSRRGVNRTAGVTFDVIVGNAFFEKNGQFAGQLGGRVLGICSTW